MLEKLVQYIFLDGVDKFFILNCLISIFLGFFISISLILSGQSWARSFTNVTTYCILPLIGLVITTVISGNIALSLGMVGALSIIRFRHPVKSPLELSIYFLLLTVGITLTSSIGKAILLTLLSMTIVYANAFYRTRKINTTGSFPALSFVRDNPQYILDITCSERDNSLANSIFLLFSNENKAQSIYSYKLAFGSKKDADSIRSMIEGKQSIKEVKFSCI